MKILDLTHPIHNGMPVYPGKNPVRVEMAATINKDGYREKHLSIDGHTGTHMDAPAHMLADGHTLDSYQISKFCGTAIILKIPENQISMDFLMSNADGLKNVDFILFNTGWSKFWGKDDYLNSFPTLTIEAAHYLTQFSIKGVGMDTISVDPIDSKEFPIHHTLFERDMVIIENLKFPEEISLTNGFLHVYPLSIADADGSPVRAVIFMEDSH